MAIIKNLSEIENLIPEPDYRLYGSNITEASSKTVTDNPLFAFTVDRKRKVIINMFRVMFILIKRCEKFHLMVANYNRENSAFTDYISIEEPKDRNLKKTDWPFEQDEIGLRLDSTCYDKNMIYFGTLVSDSNIVKEGIKKRIKNKVLTLEPVLV